MSAPTEFDTALLDAGGVRVDIDPPRATITLNRPEVLNAQTPDTWAALAAVGESLPPEIRVVVVGGAGRAFSAGLDRRLFQPDADGWNIGTLVAGSEVEGDAMIAGFQAGFSWLRDPARLTIAAVHGHAIGAGFQLALACDLRIVAEDVHFRMAETGLGLVPDLGGSYPLVHAVGFARAVELCLTGRAVAAEEAVRIGLAVRTVPGAELAAATDELVRAVLAAPAGSVRETLGLLAGVADGADPAAALAAERAAQLRLLRALFAG